MQRSRPRERFSRHSRIRRRNEFHEVFARGRRVSSEALRIVVCANDLGHSRLGLAVSRRVGGSVVRNLLKRRLREIFRRNRERVPASADVVVIPRPAAANLTFHALREAFLELMSRAQRGAPRRAERSGRNG